MKLSLTVVLLASLLSSHSATADYNENIRGVVTHVLTYTDTGRILFRLDNQPQTHPSCQNNYFSVDASVPEGIRTQILSRLLTAYATKATTNIGYDDLGDCSHGYIRVHRVG